MSDSDCDIARTRSVYVWDRDQRGDDAGNDTTRRLELAVRDLARRVRGLEAALAERTEKPLARHVGRAPAGEKMIRRGKLRIRS